MDAQRKRAKLVTVVFMIAVAGVCGCPPPGAAVQTTAVMNDYGELIPLIQPGLWRIIVRPDEPEFGAPDESAYYIELEMDEQFIGMVQWWGTVNPINNGRFDNHRWLQFRPDLKFMIQHGVGLDFPYSSFIADVDSSTYLQGEQIYFSDANPAGVRIGEFEMWRVDHVPVENGPGELVPVG